MDNKKRTRNHPLIAQLEELGTCALHEYYEGQIGSKRIHVYPYHRHPSKKDIKKMNLVFWSKQHLYPEGLIDQDIEDWEERGIKFILHLELAQMSAKEYEEYFKD